MDPDQTAPQSDLGPYCLPICKNMFEMFARRCSRQHKQMTFSDVVFLGILRVKLSSDGILPLFGPMNKCQQCKFRSDMFIVQFSPVQTLGQVLFYYLVM